jgi:hypothetical protein
MRPKGWARPTVLSSARMVGQERKATHKQQCPSHQLPTLICENEPSTQHTHRYAQSHGVGLPEAGHCSQPIQRWECGLKEVS